MNPIKVLGKLPSFYQVMLVIASIFIAGIASGASISNLNEVPATARANRLANARQDSIDTKIFTKLSQIDVKMARTDERITRLACLMTAQFEGTNPIRCDNNEK